MSGEDTFKPENFPTDGGESFLADWEADKRELAEIHRKLAAGEPVAAAGKVVTVQQQQQASGPSKQMGSGDGSKPGEWDNWLAPDLGHG